MFPECVFANKQRPRQAEFVVVFGYRDPLTWIEAEYANPTSVPRHWVDCHPGKPMRAGSEI